MMEVTERIIAALVTALILCVSTTKLLGAMQQSGYKNGGFLRWLRRKDNLFFNRLSVLALCLALATTVTALCFSFLGVKAALLCSAVPFFILLILYAFADGKYALKVPVTYTGRVKRLFAGYFFFVACTAYILIALLGFLSAWNGSELYGLIAYAPFALMPILAPFLLCTANAVTGVFENARNRKFVRRAGEKLAKTEIIRVGVVGSFGKTSVKNILKTILSEKYTVVETPESFNTPMGIAKTVFSPEFEKKQVFIAEMGARKSGDIKELCSLVQPDYAVFTGVCEQHIQTFGCIENIFKEKSEILWSVKKKAVCGEGLKAFAEAFSENERVVFIGGETAETQLRATETSFTLLLGGESIQVTTPLLGQMAVENITLSARLALEMGLTAEEIANGIGKLQPIAHRLQLLENGGVYILDDGYNCNPKGAKEGIEALRRFAGRKCIVTPGIVECGVLEEKVNGELGATIAEAELDKIILVGDTLVGAVKSGYENAGGDKEKVSTVKTLNEAQALLSKWLTAGDAVLFLNDLPDVY